MAITVRYALSLPKRAVAPTLGLASSGALSSFPPSSLASTLPRAEGAGDHCRHPLLRCLEIEVAEKARTSARKTPASEVAGSRVVVDGHADTIGAAKYNRRLVERRAKAMADAMVSLGVPMSAIDVRWTGGEVGDVTPRRR